MGDDLHRIIPLGWGIFGWVNKIIVIPVFNYLSGFISNFGIIILILTIFIKIILLPLTYKSYQSQAKMKILKPELDEIKAKMGKDMGKLQAEQMKLYKRAGVSPLGGCLPMLLQMPILIAMFRFFPSSIELRQEAFLWAKDLSTYDSIWNFPNGFSIPFYGDHVSLWTLLMTISTIIYTRMNNDMMATGGDAAKQMKIISYIMPVMFLGFFNSYSSALSYYYFLANVLTFGQQYLFKIAMDENKLRSKIEANKLKKTEMKKSRWVQRMEDLQRQRTQQMRRK
jgi:YidC/Oxa1 family membrane protein insertase